MAGLTRVDYEDVSPFADLLPHNLLLDPEGGVLLLSTPRWDKPSLALGCAWTLIPRNIEVCEESVCLTLARMHESLLRSLPVGAALQAGMTILPATTAPDWEQLRQAFDAAPVVQAQQAAIHRGLPHQDGPHWSRLREVRTWLTLRLPVEPLDPAIPALLRALLALPTRSGSQLAARLTAHLTTTLTRLEGLRTGIDATLRAAGHTLTRLPGCALGTLLAQALAPLDASAPVILPDVPLAEQVLRTSAERLPSGWAFGEESAQLTAQVLSSGTPGPGRSVSSSTWPSSIKRRRKRACARNAPSPFCNGSTRWVIPPRNTRPSETNWICCSNNSS